MAKYVLDFSDDQDIGRNLRASLEPITFKPSIAEPEPTITDNILEKTFCYSSYYSMVFAAFCTFAPMKVVYAAEMVSSVIPL